MITDRVLSEWEAHWRQADEFHSQLAARYGSDLSEALKLHQHAVLREYGYATERGAKSFESWARSRRDLRPVLRRYGMEVLTADEEDFDRDFAVAFAEGIKESQERSGRAWVRDVVAPDGWCERGFGARDALGTPSSLVPTAWFVAFDRTSDEVYRDMTDDAFPLVIRASTWLLHYAAFEPTGAADSRAQFADKLSEDLIVDALSVAASYTNDEMLELGDLLAEGDEIDREDVHAFLVAGFVHPESFAERQVRDFVEPDYYTKETGSSATAESRVRGHARPKIA